MQSFEIIKPIHVLTPYVKHYWILEDNAEVPVSERTLPTGCVQLIFHRGKRLLLVGKKESQPQAFICGQCLGFSDVMSAGRIEMIAVVFQPYAARAILQLPLDLFYGKLIAVDALEDPELSILSGKVTEADDHETCVRLIERFLIRRLYRFEGYAYNVKRITAVLYQINKQAKTDIPELSEIACLSPKQFNRIFLSYVGATPKAFLRIVRMQRALFKIQQDSSISFAQLAYECGFSDQSHLIKEFKLFSGYTPTEYLSLCAPYSDYFSG
ncbi:helix-turn-helix domain-containing protein [Parabacteroides sp. ZJ-118]|uniref:AraC family transcriptional regulator n=1 Tax=Parabacteroides sp. ZJ-118 TaxID=2709398 RepID=UPI0013EBB02D|nr:helix-turn-helix domain-containing protein [Parabacteroides sp. ZJ-118]